MSADPSLDSVAQTPSRRKRVATGVESLKSVEGFGRARMALPRAPLGKALGQLLTAKSMAELRNQTEELRAQALKWNKQQRKRNSIESPDTSDVSLARASGLVWFQASVWQRYLSQIDESKTLKRALYYVERLQRGVEKSKTSSLNDVNLYRWQEYDDLLTDSLWVMDKRDRTGVHSAGYWGNFIPQIPQQLLRRYTKAGEWVLDPFLGSGTTLIECQRLARNGIGVELQAEVAARTQLLLNAERNTEESRLKVQVGDSRTVDYRSVLKELDVKSVQFLMLHPPYHDIIQFSDDERCLSNANGLGGFLDAFSEVAANGLSVLDKGRYLAVVIGDKYSGSEWIPLGFKCMQVMEKLGCSLKSIVVKNFEATAGKRQTSELWRYRALAGGFYVFKHEYIFVMQKS